MLLHTCDETTSRNTGVLACWSIRYLAQTPEVAERSYDLLLISLSRNGEITDQEWDILTEKRKTADEVRDFSLLREVQKELKIK